MARKKHQPQQQLNETKEPKKKVMKDSWFETISDSFLNFITKGNLEEQTSNFQVSYNKILSENHVKQVIQILRMPALVKVGYLENIRVQLLESIPIQYVPNIDIQIHEYYVRNLMSVTDKKMTKLRGSVSSGYNIQLNNIKKMQKYLDTLNDGRITQEDIELQRHNLKLRERKKHSFDEVAEHKRKGGEYITAYIFLEVTASDKDLLNKAVENLMGILQKGYNEEPYEFQIIHTNVLDYVKEYGIASFLRAGKKGLNLPPMDIPSSIISVDEEFNSGIIRSPQPRVCLGNLVDNNYPLHVDFTETDNSYNIMLLGKTGSGKTKAAMYMFLGLMLDPRTNIMVDDLKGLEWSAFAKIFDKHAVVSFNLLNPTFVNTLKIPDWKRFKFSSPKAAYILAYNSTVRLLGSLCMCKPDDVMVINQLLSDFVDYIYLSSRIDVQEPGTYSKSHNMHFADTISTKWDEFNQQASFKGKYDSIIVDMVNEVLYKYFSRRGAKRFIFETEVDIESLMDKKFIVFDHGKDIAGGSGSKSMEEIMCGMIQKSYVSNLYTALNFMRGEYTYELMEEVVRQLADPFVTSYLVDELVGKRSSNKRNILAFNSLDVLLNPTVNSDDIGKIREQIGIYIVGKCDDRVCRDLVHHIGRPEIYETLRKVSLQSDFDSKYEHSFAYINYHCGTVRGIHTYKCIIPKVILDTYMNRNIYS